MFYGPGEIRGIQVKGEGFGEGIERRTGWSSRRKVAKASPPPTPNKAKSFVRKTNREPAKAHPKGGWEGSRGRTEKPPGLM